MPLAGGLIAGAGVLTSGIESLIQGKKADAIMPKKDPVYTIPQEFYANREIARQMAQQGTPQAVINNNLNGINQNQAAAIAAAQNSNNPGGAITAIVRQGNQAKDKLNAEDAQARENNQRYFINQNAQVAGQELDKQQNDVFDKFTRDFNQAQAYRGASQQNLNNAIQSAQAFGQDYMNYKSNNPTAPTTGLSAQDNAAINTGTNTNNAVLNRNNQGFNQYLLNNPLLLPQ